jgi:SAM-dependent methyltransferase
MMRLVWRIWSATPAPLKDLTRLVPPLHRWRKRVGLHTATHRPHDDVYNADYYKAYDRLGVLHQHSCAVIAETVCERMAPACVLDLGCGTGELLAAFRDRGVTTYGLENSSAAIHRCAERGLRVDKLDLETSNWSPAIGMHDVVVSTEVAEHLPATCADRYVCLMCAASRRWVVLTGATPGQGGTDHVNEQPHEYWIQKLAARGFSYHRDLSERWRADWKDKAICTWYYLNVMVFEREGGPSRE